MKNNYKNRNLIARVLDIAKLHISEGVMATSAEACYKRACDIMSPAWNNNRADIQGADYEALRSLSYSIGASHSDYKLAEGILAGAYKETEACAEKRNAERLDAIYSP
jgi:hypothetical protein